MTINSNDIWIPFAMAMNVTVLACPMHSAKLLSASGNREVPGFNR